MVQVTVETTTPRTLVVATEVTEVVTPTEEMIDEMTDEVGMTETQAERATDHETQAEILAETQDERATELHEKTEIEEAMVKTILMKLLEYDSTRDPCTSI